MEEFEFISITVGEEFPLYQNNKMIISGGDGAFFESEERGHGYSFVVYLNNIHKSEVDIIRNERVDMRVVLSKDGMILPIFKFGDTALTFEAVFDPTKYEDNRALQLYDDNNLLHLFAIDSRTNIVHAIRKMNFPLKFINLCKKHWTSSYQENNYSERYDNFIDTLRERFSVDALWKLGEDVGSLGENFNLEDIK